MEIDLTGATVYLTDGQFDTVEAVKAKTLASCEYGEPISYAASSVIQQPYFSVITDGRLIVRQAICGAVPSGCTIDIPHTRLTLGN